MNFPPPFLSNPTLCYPQSMALPKRQCIPTEYAKKPPEEEEEVSFFVRVLVLQLFMTLAYRNVLLFTLQSVFC